MSKIKNLAEIQSDYGIKIKEINLNKEFGYIIIQKSENETKITIPVDPDIKPYDAMTELIEYALEVVVPEYSPMAKKKTDKKNKSEEESITEPVKTTQAEEKNTEPVTTEPIKKAGRPKKETTVTNTPAQEKNIINTTQSVNDITDNKESKDILPITEEPEDKTEKPATTEDEITVEPMATEADRERIIETCYKKHIDLKQIAEIIRTQFKKEKLTELTKKELQVIEEGIANK
jgi:hypothetical protein